MIGTDVEAGGLIGEAWGIFKENKKVLILILLIQFVITGILSGIGEAAGEASSTLSLMNFLSSIVGVLFGVINIKVCLNLIDGKNLDLKQALVIDDWGVVGRYFITNILVGLMVALGFILLIIPGIIWSFAYGLVPYLAIEKKMGYWEYLKESKKLMNGYKWKLFVLGVVLVLFNMAGAIALGIGLIVTVPTSALAMTIFYRRIVEGNNLTTIGATEAPMTATQYVSPSSAPEPTQAPLPPTSDPSI